MEIKNGMVRSRVYERGVENETFSSGTGTTAVALSAYLKMNSDSESIKVQTKGGELEVSFTYNGNHHFSNIWLKGKVRRVYSGSVEI